MAKRILLVDDDRAAVRLTSQILEMAGYEVVDAASGSEAFRCLSKGSFDLILLDFDMKDIKGDKICSMLTSDDQYKDIPIVIITAHVEQERRVLLGYGATDVIYKPFDTEEFMVNIKKYLKEE